MAFVLFWAIKLLTLLPSADDDEVDAPEFKSNTANDVRNKFVSLVVAAADVADGTQSANEVLLFLAKTAAVTDSMAAATFRGVTMICGRMCD